MFVIGSDIVLSASDLVASAQCEFAFLRRLDLKLGRDVSVPKMQDPMLQRAALLGDEHETNQLETYKRVYGEDGVKVIAALENHTLAGLREKAVETIAAFESKADIIFQATFFDESYRPAAKADEPNIFFLGFADFLARKNVDDHETMGSWQVQDTKLARSPRVAAILQIASYAKQIEKLGFAVSDTGVLILGDGTRSEHDLKSAMPVLSSRSERMIELTLEGHSRNKVVEWDSAGVFACGRCEVCEPEVINTRDTLMVAGLTVSQRQKLRAAGIKTIDELADLNNSSNPLQISGINQKVLQKISAQASIQVQNENSEQLAWALLNPQNLAAIPKPSAGDIFFDFEGDPLFKTESNTGKPIWGIDYLFGYVDNDEKFECLWAHDLEEEKTALIDFVAFVQARLEKYPDMHIYHYASYEKTHLAQLSLRHGVCESEIDGFLRAGLLVDLYPIVKQSILVGSRSYSIKKLEPLYMGDEIRDEDGVTSGADSVAEYALAAELMRSGDAAREAEALRRLDAIADYNRYDCVSTLRLRNWLQLIAKENGVAPAEGRAESAGLDDEPEPVENVESHLAKELKRIAVEHSLEENEDMRAVYALAASAIDYHAREKKSFWWAHYSRLEGAVEDWAETKDVFVADGRARLLENWHRPPGKRKDRRSYFLAGSFAPGSANPAGKNFFALYDDHEGPEPDASVIKRFAHQCTVVEVQTGGVIIEEMLRNDAEPWAVMPVALTPGPPPMPGKQIGAIEHFGEKLVNAHLLGIDIDDPVVQIIKRAEPIFENGAAIVKPSSREALELGGSDDHRSIGAVIASLLNTRRGALAVQGPPGTGKTYLGARVIKELVEKHGWRIGVVAQSHRVVENMLDEVVSAGISKSRVAKALQGGDKRKPDELKFEVIAKNSAASFLDKNVGCVIGGTAWDFSDESRVAREQLDLLVIDEAGQFSLAPTIAAAVAAKRLLLLGDPGQLPQVSQGTHPEPVDESALGWLLGDHETLPEELGFFLAETRRMRPELTRIVSKLSYSEKLHSHESVLKFNLQGVGPAGLTWHPVEHDSNTTSSIEEAEVVVSLVKNALGEIAAEDLIVVAAYNAQVEVVTDALTKAGISGVRVGTVDKFQGQEAHVAIVTLAASSPADIPRGVEFLLLKNRLNVAISRAKWAAHLVSSKNLGGSGLPPSIEAMNALSGYLLLTSEALTG